MTAPQTHRLSLLLALAGALLMLATAVARIAPGRDYDLPRFESGRPALPDWPTHTEGAPRA